MNNSHKQTPMTNIDNLFSPGHDLAYEHDHPKPQSAPEKQPGGYFYPMNPQMMPSAPAYPPYQMQSYQVYQSLIPFPPEYHSQAPPMGYPQHAQPQKQRRLDPRVAQHIQCHCCCCTGACQASPQHPMMQAPPAQHAPPMQPRNLPAAESHPE